MVLATDQTFVAVVAFAARLLVLHLAFHQRSAKFILFACLHRSFQFGARCFLLVAITRLFVPASFAAGIATFLGGQLFVLAFT